MVAWCLGPSESRAYASDVAGTWFGPIAVAAADRLSARPGQRVLDVACGAGRVGTAAAQRGARVVGLDVSLPMLRVAARSVAGSRARDWLRADAHALPFPDASFDAACCPHGLMFFDAPERALAELRRVVAPGGTVVATTWAARESNPHEVALAESFGAHARAAAGFFDSLFSLADHRALERLALRAGLADARAERLQGEAVFPSRASYWRGLAWGRPLADELRALPAPDVRQIKEGSLARMKPYAAERGFRSPMEAIVLVARVP